MKNFPTEAFLELQKWWEDRETTSKPWPWEDKNGDVMVGEDGEDSILVSEFGLNFDEPGWEGYLTDHLRALERVLQYARDHYNTR